MERSVTIRPSGHVFRVTDDETVLTAALREGFPLPYGCRNGACGTCKGRVLSGTVDYGTHHESALTEREQAQGYALFCCARPLGDIEIECREVGAVKDIAVRKMPCRVQKMHLAAPDVMILHLRLPQTERLQYLAGQYIEFLLKDGSRRSFSMANPPHDDELLELHLRNYGGAFSRHVFGSMKERDILRLEGPFGTFYLREDSDKPIVLVASGTGFAPIKAIVEHAFYVRMQREMVLYWGGRTRADLYMHELAEAWAREHPGFRYVPVLSEARDADAWAGRTGFVHEAVMADLPDLSGHQVYACGNPLMVEAARRDFSARCKLPEGSFFADAFTPAA